MKTVAAITEYNPFHKGHQFHIEETRKKLGDCLFIALMSSSFVQRGEPAIIDKWSRAKAAVQGGCDMVIELPFCYSCQSAEDFAYGGVLMASMLQCDYLSFGAETKELSALEALSETALRESEDFKRYLKKGLAMGLSYSQSKIHALSLDTAQRTEFSYESLMDVFSGSNSILALEYMVQIKGQKSSLRPLLVRRKGASYNNLSPQEDILNATLIRSLIHKGEYEEVQRALPQGSFQALMDFKAEWGRFPALEDYGELFLYLIRHYHLCGGYETEDIVRRVRDMSISSNSLEELIESSRGKNISPSRLKRFICHVITFENSRREVLTPPLRILAMKSRAFPLVKNLASQGVPIFSNFNKFYSEGNDPLLQREQKITDSYFFPLKKTAVGYDYTKQCYIELE